MAAASRQAYGQFEVPPPASPRFLPCGFLGPKPGLIIEHDGGQPAERLEREAASRAYLVEQAYGVIGFWQVEVNLAPTGGMGRNLCGADRYVIARLGRRTE
ncbi:MAG: DUF559 domain-containing protein [Deltaproteobacteria bacterium]|nr:DUF559 domain-containing protein [Deltaproteobacteria bacterium]